MTTSINQHFSPWSLLKFAFPSIIMMMFMSLYTIVDGIFISRFIGSNALSSLNIVYPVDSIVIAIGTMLATGGNAVISRYLGEEKIQLAKECLSLFTLTGFLLSLLMSILSLLFPDFISRALGANDLLLADCRTYLSILMGFAPACMLQTLFQSYLVTAGAPHLGLFLTMIAGIINAGLDYRILRSWHCRSCPGYRTRPDGTGPGRTGLFSESEACSSSDSLHHAHKRTDPGLLQRFL